jgi:hypothetical protein
MKSHEIPMKSPLFMVKSQKKPVTATGSRSADPVAALFFVRPLSSRGGFRVEIRRGFQAFSTEILKI